MLFEQIAQKCLDLTRKYKTRDPFEIAENLHISVILADDFTKLKGMYVIVNKNPFVFLNSRLDEPMQKIVLAHEIGHDRLHRDFARQAAFEEFSLYKMDSRPEIEANIFAAEMLIDTDRVLELIYESLDIEQIAHILKTDINLVAIKVSGLIKRGYDLKLQSFRSDFLK
ncbi:MAG: ImmA/IrrE family metallo-endopeptidase [Ruminococcus sp.]|jgi:Zn-dependent peptidase ImmA (M78 family)|nr:ImmA/IrrE family metallo-endopeptidase [Ruminococcus sp.]